MWYKFKNIVIPNSVNVMNIFNTSPRRSRSHGHRHYTSPSSHDIELNDLLSYIKKPLGIHHIRTKLFSLPLSRLNTLYKSCLKNDVTDRLSDMYKLTAIVLDIGNGCLNRLPVLKPMMKKSVIF